MKKWKDLNTNEKVMLGAIAVFLVALALNWKHFVEEIKKVFQKFG